MPDAVLREPSASGAGHAPRERAEGASAANAGNMSTRAPAHRTQRDDRGQALAVPALPHQGLGALQAPPPRDAGV